MPLLSLAFTCVNMFALFLLVVIAHDRSLPVLGAFEDEFLEVSRNLHGIAESICTSNFFRALFNVFIEFLVFPIVVTRTSHPWCIVELWLICEGCDIVQSDHAPQAGVAQGIFDGELVRRRVGHQVELEEEQDKEVERRVRRDAQRTTHRCACMDDME